MPQKNPGTSRNLFRWKTSGGKKRRPRWNFIIASFPRSSTPTGKKELTANACYSKSPRTAPIKIKNGMTTCHFPLPISGKSENAACPGSVPTPIRAWNRAPCAVSNLNITAISWAPMPKIWWPQAPSIIRSRARLKPNVSDWRLITMPPLPRVVSRRAPITRLISPPGITVWSASTATTRKPQT